MEEFFLRRLKTEYLHQLQKREKWHEQSRNIKTGDVVLVKDENPRKEWPVEAVRRTFESKDGFGKKVELAVVKNGTLALCARPKADLVLLLEVDE